MTYQQIKDKLIEEERVLDHKSFKKFIVNYSLFVLGICGLIGFASLVLIGMNLAILLGVVCIFGFISGLDFISSDNDVLGKAIKLVKFWWVFYILGVILFFVFKSFLFI